MDRLTERRDGEIFAICENCPRHVRPCYAENCLEVMSDCLAAYEDTGLDPGEIEAVMALARG